MNQDEYNALAARHGGEAGKTALDPTIDNPNKVYSSDPDKIANPNPTYRYVFKDGTYIEARDTLKGQNGQVDLEVTNPGTALKADDTTKPTSVSAPSTEKYIVTRQPDGTLKASDNPNFKGDGKDPSSSVTTFGDQLIGVSDDGKGNLTTKVLLTKDPTQTLQAVTLPDGSLGSFDPKTGTVTTIAAAGAKNPGTPVKGGDGKFYIWDPKANNGAGGMVDSGMPSGASSVVGTGADDEFTYALDGQGNEIPGSRRPNPNYKKPGAQLLGTDTNSEFTYAVDKDGNEVPGSRRPNPNFNKPKPTELTTDTVSAVRGLLQPDGTVKWIKNDQQLTVSQAMADLMNQAGMKVTTGSMSMDDAKNMLTSAVNLMNAQTAKTTAQTAQQRLGVDAANNALTAVNNAAQTGAGLLQNRVTNAMSGLNTAIGAIGSSKMTSAPAGMGENLVGGLSEWVTGLGGGQPVYDSAAAMVNAANPSVKGDPTVATQAYAALRGAMDLYKQQTGQEWQPQQPFNSPVTAPVGAAAGTAGGGAAPVLTNSAPNPALAAANATNAQGFNPQASTAALNAQGLMDNPQGRAIAAGQTPIASQGAPTTPGLYNPAWQQGIRGAVGQPATGPVVGSVQPIPSVPIPGYSPYGPFQFQAPVTV